MSNNIQGTAKLGLGASLVIDGQQFDAAWLPEAINQARNTIDTTHAQSTGQRGSKPDELTEPLEITGEFYFDPQLKSLVELMTSAGVAQEREIYCILPRTSTAQGVTHENGYFYLPAGSIGIGTINIGIDDTMKAEFVITAGTVAVVIENQKTVASNVPTSTSIVTTNLATTLADEVVATITGVGVTHGPTIFFTLGGTNVADFYLEGKFVKALADGGGGTGVKALTVSCAGYRAWENDDTGEHLTGEAIGFTLT